MMLQWTLAIPLLMQIQMPSAPPAERMAPMPNDPVSRRLADPNVVVGTPPPAERKGVVALPSPN